MVQVARWRVILVILATIWGVIFALPNVLPASVRDRLPDFVPKQVINLGLDLRGGSHILLEVDSVALSKEKLENELQLITRELQQAKPRILFEGARVEGQTARLRVLEAKDLERALKIVEKYETPQAGLGGQATRLYDVTSTPDGTISVTMTRDGLNEMARDAVGRSIEVIRRRIDELGVSEVSISAQGADRIVVQAPGDNDPEALKRRIGQTAKMTFHMVDETVGPDDIAAGRLPPLTHLAQSSDPSLPPVPIRNRIEMSGEDLMDAQATFNQQNQSAVSLRFNQRGAMIFCRLSSQYVGKRFATVLDDKVITSPVFREPICGGSGQIDGMASPEEAQELAALLRGGALPAPLKVIMQSSVGPDLGRDAIKAGAEAGLVAVLSVVVFMLLAYGFTFGGFALIALAVNFAMLIAAMTQIQATLTLPGIAGLILTIAMAVDANVLIYERMRDEQRAGRSPALSIEAGFGKAMVTIIDANLTTLLAAGILFYFGAGPVKGFAWTLSIGVFTSVFTAVLVTQVLIAFWFRWTRPKELPI